MVFYPLAATLISAAFALTLWLQYRTKRRPFTLVWAIALTIYAVATLMETLGASGLWNPFLYKMYYFAAAILLVGVLGLGTIYLLAPRYASLAITILVFLAAVGLLGVIGAQVGTSVLETRQVPQRFPTDGIFNLLAIAMAVFINLAGTIVLVGGAFWSAYGLWRRGQPRERVWSNVLIAIGALIVASGTGVSRLGVYELFYVSQAIGVLVMFAGFLTAQRVPSRVVHLGTA